MKYIGRTFALLALTLGMVANASAQTVPDKYTIVRVNSLADSGPGTLRECFDKAIARVCMFETSGRIRLKTPLVARQPNLIVAGQTAPSPGIMITNAGIRIETNNVRIEHLEVRVGDSAEGPAPDKRDSVSIQGDNARNITIRNVSMSWAVDENFSTWRAVANISVESCIISEALYRSIHPKGPHSMGALIGESARNVSFVGNLLAANNDRNIRWKYDTTGEMVGNVIFGWGGTSSWNTTNISDVENFDKPTYLNIVGNVYMAGPSGLKTAYALYSQNTPSSSKIYMTDNIAPRLTNLEAKYFSSAPVVNGTAQVQPAASTLDVVLASAGSRPWDRNAVDVKVINGVRSGTLGIMDRVSTWPVVAENKRGLSIAQSVVTPAELDAALSNFELANPVTVVRSADVNPAAEPTPATNTTTVAQRADSDSGLASDET